MIRRNEKTRMYQAPHADMTPLELENNLCATVRFNIQVREWDNVNADEDADEAFYFES